MLRLRSAHTKALVSAIAVGLLSGAAFASPTAHASDTPTPQDTAASNTAQLQAAATGKENGKNKATPTKKQTSKPITLQSVNVTGSLIRSVNLQDQQPVLTVTRAQITQLGVTTVGQLLQQLPIATPGANREDTFGTHGTETFNMRNLGASRVLVLVNGHRWVTSSNGTVDLSTIPTAIIQRVEVLESGGSAVYGSDAVTGVVNIITRSRFHGSEVEVHYGANQAGDGQQRQFSLTSGANTKRSSTVFNISYTSDGGVWDKTRPITRFPFGPQFPDQGQASGKPGQPIFTTADGSEFMLSAPGLNSRDISNYTRLTPANQNISLYNVLQDFQYATPLQQKSLYVSSRYRFTDDIVGFVTAMYSQRDVNDVFAPDVIDSAGQGTDVPELASFGLNGLLSGQSYYNPLPGQDLSVSGTADIPRDVYDSRRSMHFNAGVDGQFELGDQPWTWTADVNWNQGNLYSEVTGLFNRVNESLALGPSFRQSNGNVVCGTPDNVIASCVPWNVLGGSSATAGNAALQTYLHTYSQDTYSHREADLTVDASGGIFKIPFGGTVQGAVGFQRRVNHGDATPESEAFAGLSDDLSSGPESGGFAVNSLYGELNIPVIKNGPLTKLVSLDIAMRHSDYSNFGTSNRWKFGFEWKPISDLLFRGNYSQSLRAPTVNDLFSALGSGFDFYTDPCDSKFGAAVYGAAVHGACVASLRSAGVKDAGNFRQVGLAGVTNQEAPQTPFPFFGGGNPDLDPETATTKTLGFVYSPHQLPGFNLITDWYSIELTNEISSVDADEVLQFCYEGDQEFCNKFTRNGQGEITSLFTNLANIGLTTEKGYDTTVSYTSPEFSWGRFRVRSQNSYISQYTTQSGPGTPILVDNNGFYPLWRLRSNTSFTWARGPWSATWLVEYYSSLKESCVFGANIDCNEPDFVSPVTGLTPTNRVGSVAFSDVSASWQAPWNATLVAGINNVFGRVPPIMTAAEETSLVSIDSAYPIDRSYFVDYTQRF